LFVCDGGTSAPQALLVDVTAPPEVFLGNDTTIMQGESIVLDARNPGSSYLWSTGATTRTITVSTTGTYAVTVTNDCGTGWDDIYVSVYIGIGENNTTIEARVFFYGQFIRIEKGSEEIRDIKLIDSGGRIIYQSSYIPAIPIKNKGLYVLILGTIRGHYAKKILCN
jgi:hypothetical protein